tara:strand:+ start:1149 stop:1646 length:498 start_codon:yes stop_codon:yes gene_type:complete
MGITNRIDRISKSDALEASTYLFLQIPSLVLSGWSFKLHNSLIEADEGGEGLIGHSEGGILGAGVCKLGKIGAWIIIGWVLLSTILLYAKVNLIIVIVLHSILLSILVFLTLILNTPLFIRTLPFICLQIGIILFLINCHKKKKNNNEEEEEEGSDGQLVQRISL